MMNQCNKWPQFPWGGQHPVPYMSVIAKGRQSKQLWAGLMRVMAGTELIAQTCTMWLYHAGPALV